MAAREKNRWAHFVRLWHHTSKCAAASVKHAAATMDQMTVTQLIYHQKQNHIETKRDQDRQPITAPNQNA
jgi:hypothetical protein